MLLFEENENVSETTRNASAVGCITTTRSTGITVPPAMCQQWQEYYRMFRQGAWGRFFEEE
jgi:hypothetical protein